MSEIKVEIGNYFALNKEILKASFSVVIYPTGQKILDCEYYVKGDNRWFNWPQKKVTYKDGRKPLYIPYISFLNKEYLAELKEAILQALKDYKPKEKHDQNQTSSYPQDDLQGEASALPF